MLKKTHKSNNFLHLIPKKNSKIYWVTTEQGFVQIIIPRNGIFEKILRPFLKIPKVMRIDLDDMGTHIWNAIDDKRNIDEISKMLKEEFGHKAEPLYERLGKFIVILKNNKFITFENMNTL